MESEMSREPKFSDEFLNAFVDGELAPEDRTRIYVELRQDETLNRRVCELRNLRELVRFAYAEPPGAPTTAAAAAAKVGRQIPRRPTATWLGLGLAASLAAALVTGALMGGTRSTPSHPARHDTAADSAGGSGGTSMAAEQEPVKVLIHLSTADPKRVREALDEIEDLIRFYRRQQVAARIEVVANGDGIEMLRADRSPFAARITRMQKEYDNLTFAACQNTIERLARERGDATRLLPGVIVIDSGVAQIMRRQHQGWAYIRV
jgi:intracellular sulfur oxidation DsrE/DsrF family protein